MYNRILYIYTICIDRHRYIQIYTVYLMLSACGIIAVNLVETFK